MRIKLFLLLLMVSLSCQAGWTGVGAFVNQGQSDWQYAGQLRQADLNQYGLHIEEKTQVDLRVGVSAGQFSLRLLDLVDPGVAQKYYGQFLSFYLRLPVRLNNRLSLHGRINYQYNLGKKSQEESSETEISWTEITLDLGLSLNLGPVALRPFLNFRSMDGDISTQSVARLFKLDKHLSSGLLIDYLLEPSAYVRLSSTFESNPSLQISFVREY